MHRHFSYLENTDGESTQLLENPTFDKLCLLKMLDKVSRTLKKKSFRIQRFRRQFIKAMFIRTDPIDGLCCMVLYN